MNLTRDEGSSKPTARWSDFHGGQNVGSEIEMVQACEEDHKCTRSCERPAVIGLHRGR